MAISNTPLTSDEISEFLEILNNTPTLLTTRLEYPLPDVSDSVTSNKFYFGDFKQDKDDMANQFYDDVEMEKTRLNNIFHEMVNLFPEFDSNSTLCVSAYTLMWAEYDKQYAIKGRGVSAQNPFGEKPNGKKIAREVCKYMCAIIHERKDDDIYNGSSEEQPERYDVREWVRS